MLVDACRRFVDWAAHSEGSTRPAALIRIGLGFLLWARWAAEVSPVWEPSVERVLLAVAFAVATTLMVVGLWTRFAVPAAAAVTGAMYVYGVVNHGVVSHGVVNHGFIWYAHHTYLLVAAVFYVALTPSERSYSLDRWLALRRARKLGVQPPPERGNLLGLRLIALQVATIYFWGAFDKTSLGWLNGARVEQILMAKYTGSDYPAWPLFHEAAMLLGATTVVLEYALAVGLFLPRARRILMPLGVLFHGALYFVVPVKTFSATMILLYLAFFEPDDVHRAIDDVQAPS